MASNRRIGASEGATRVIELVMSLQSVKANSVFPQHTPAGVVVEQISVEHGLGRAGECAVRVGIVRREYHVVGILTNESVETGFGFFDGHIALPAEVVGRLQRDGTR